MNNIIGIIGAMEVEVDLIIKDLKDVKKEKYGSIVFYKGTLGEKNIVVSECGIGKVNSAMCTQIMITKFGAKKIINTGVAGALSDSLDIYDVVIGDTMIQYDFDLSAFGRKLGHIPNLENEKIVSTKSLGDKAYKSAIKVLSNEKVSRGIVLTGDKFLEGNEDKQWLVKELNGTCVEMESGAIAQVCFLNEIDFIIIRAISDKANEGAPVDFDKFVNKASKTSYEIVKELLKMI